jgi:hypothetical protein
MLQNGWYWVLTPEMYIGERRAKDDEIPRGLGG